MWLSAIWSAIHMGVSGCESLADSGGIDVEIVTGQRKSSPNSHEAIWPYVHKCDEDLDREFRTVIRQEEKLLQHLGAILMTSSQVGRLFGGYTSVKTTASAATTQTSSRKTFANTPRGRGLGIHLSHHGSNNCHSAPGAKVEVW